MKTELTFSIVQGQEVADWVVEGTNANLSNKAVAIGLVKGNELVAAMAYDGWNGTNIFCHQRIDGKTNRAYWKAVFSYPFNDLGLSLIHI